ASPSRLYDWVVAFDWVTHGRLSGVAKFTGRSGRRLKGRWTRLEWQREATALPQDSGGRPSCALSHPPCGSHLAHHELHSFKSYRTWIQTANPLGWFCYLTRDPIS